MRKEEQYAINRECLEAITECNANKGNFITSKRLRNCSAVVLEYENYYILQSYDTLIAFIDKATDTLYDVLRYVYGFTSTSAQHISKFKHDYGADKWGCHRELRWYSV